VEAGIDTQRGRAVDGETRTATPVETVLADPGAAEHRLDVDQPVEGNADRPILRPQHLAGDRLARRELDPNRLARQLRPVGASHQPTGRDVDDDAGLLLAPI
jgi:hypothetical protein